MRSDCFTDALYLALVCYFCKCGLTQYFFETRTFATIAGTLMQFHKPLYLFSRYKINTKVCKIDLRLIFAYTLSHYHCIYCEMLGRRFLGLLIASDRLGEYFIGYY